MKMITLALLFLTFPVAGREYLPPLAPPLDPLVEYRQCGAPPRTADGTIKRSSAVTTAYRRVHPCPVTGTTTGACPGWQMNHIIPLSSGGCDSVTNLTWMPIQIKICTASWCIDRWERTYYAVPYGILPQWTTP